MYSREVRAHVIRASRQDPRPPFRIIDDLSTRDLTEKKRVAPYMKHLYEAGHRPSFRSGKVYANGAVVSREAIDKFLAQGSQQAPLDPNVDPSDDLSGNASSNPPGASNSLPPNGTNDDSG